MHSWRWLSIGIALLAGGVGLAVISAMTSTLRGSAHVLTVNEPPAVKHFGRCTLSVIIYAKNTEPIYIKLLEDDVPLEKWPRVGDDLPVTVAANDARVVTVLWDRVPTHKQSSMARRRAEAREEAEAAAASEAAARAQAEAAAEPDADEDTNATAARAANGGDDGLDEILNDDEPTVYAQATPADAASDYSDDYDERGDLISTGPSAVLDLGPSEYSVGAGDAPGTRATAVITSRGRRGKPSPRPRPPADDFDTTETVTAVSFGPFSGDGPIPPMADPATPDEPASTDSAVAPDRPADPDAQSGTPQSGTPQSGSPQSGSPWATEPTDPTPPAST